MIKHIVLFKFKADTLQSDRQQLAARFRAMSEHISEIISLEVGENVVQSPRAYDLALVIDFNDLDALKRYAAHPDHVPASEFAKSICENIVSVDYEH